jgi:hypothetical protein
MSFDPHSPRFDSRWLSRETETDGEQAFEAPDLFPFSSSEKLSSNVTDQELDEALEQIVSERCCVCRLCMAILGSDGFVLS